MSLINETALYEHDSNNKPLMRVSIGKSGLLEGVQYNDIRVTYPSGSIENYSYYLNDVLKATIEITYTNSSKSVLLRARRI